MTKLTKSNKAPLLRFVLDNLSNLITFGVMGTVFVYPYPFWTICPISIHEICGTTGRQRNWIPDRRFREWRDLGSVFYCSVAVSPFFVSPARFPYLSHRNAPVRCPVALFFSSAEKAFGIADSQKSQKRRFCSLAITVTGLCGAQRLRPLSPVFCPCTHLKTAKIICI